MQSPYESRFRALPRTLLTNDPPITNRSLKKIKNQQLFEVLCQAAAKSEAHGNNLLVHESTKPIVLPPQPHFFAYDPRTGNRFPPRSKKDIFPQLDDEFCAIP
jgi:hypothetical protein